MVTLVVDLDGSIGDPVAFVGVTPNASRIPEFISLHPHPNLSGSEADSGKWPE
jgi:hypothetical protein